MANTGGGGTAGGEGIITSIVIPARNAADTIGRTLDSVCQQTSARWEAIVVDNGSTDQTMVVAGDYAARNDRIRIISERQPGVSRARNAGIAAARFDWLLFLDADDWILPTFLEDLSGCIARMPEIDVCCCGWEHVDNHDHRHSRTQRTVVADMYPVVAARPPFAIHSCLVRKECVIEAGGFDPTLVTCEDWDLWQRLARIGSRFGGITKPLACYRMRPDSASINFHQTLADGLRVIAVGHSNDPRVRNPSPQYADGLPHADSAQARFLHVCWAAALCIGAEKDAKSLLQFIAEDRCPELDSLAVTDCLFSGVPVAKALGCESWPQLWSTCHDRLIDFLVALETHARADHLARRVQLLLERRVADLSGSSVWTGDIVSAAPVEITESIRKVSFAPSVERFVGNIFLHGERLGCIELPICDGVVAAEIIADSIAHAFAWAILEAFFGRRIYQQEIRFGKNASGSDCVWRGQVCLATKVSDGVRSCRADLHNHVGWTVFLQELWNRPDWSADRLYDCGYIENSPTLERGTDVGWVAVELSDALPSIPRQMTPLSVVVEIGGTPATILTVAAGEGVVSSQALRVQITEALGLELLKIVVREALIGVRWTFDTLRLQLSKNLQQNRTVQTVKIGSMDLLAIAPGRECILHRIRMEHGPCTIVGRRKLGFPNGASSRRAAVPRKAASAFLSACHGEYIAVAPAGTRSEARAVYAPDLLWRGCDEAPQTSPAVTTPAGAGAGQSVRHDFEALFASSTDPWRYTSSYERVKYAQTLSLLPADKRIKRSLELACAEGHFTQQLASRVETLVATDISEIALQRAARRCAAHSNVCFAKLNIADDPIPEGNDLIVCSEVLYYLGTLDRLRAVASRIAAAIVPGGHLIMAHAFVAVDSPEQHGFAWNVPFGANTVEKVFSEIPGFSLVKTLHSDLYAIQLFEKDPSFRLRAFRRKVAPRTEIVRHGVLSPQAAQSVGRAPAVARVSRQNTIVTHSLPILMYHRVAEDGAPAAARYRVTPAAFEAQLQYLRECGFYSVQLEEWRHACETKRPLPGRAIMLTFDDGYADFKSMALPILKRYGFSCVLFAVANRVGQTNDWDAFKDAEAVPLLSWDELAEVRGSGVQIGSHSFSHRRMTALSPTQIVEETCRSKRILEERLATPMHAFAYPYGETDAVVEHLTGASGYLYGFTCRPEWATFKHPMIALPRIEIRGTDTLQDFILKLPKTHSA